MATNTTCTTIQDAGEGKFSGLAIGSTVIMAVSALYLGIHAYFLIFVASAATPASLLVAAGVLLVMATAGIVTLVELRDYFFNKRLVCIQEDTCAIGQMIVAEHNGDGDRSLNCVLAPADFDTTTLQDYQFRMWQSRELVFGDLNNDGQGDVDLLSRGWHLDPFNNRSLEVEVFPKTWGLNNLPLFHCEIEGTKFDDWTNALIGILSGYIALAIAAAAVAAVANAAGPIGWALWALLALLILILIIFGIDLTNEDDEGSAEVSDLGNAVPNGDGVIIEDHSGNHVQNGDHIAFHGRHVIDTGHNPGCWNEIHPIRAITKIAKGTYDQVGFEQKANVYDKYCAALHTFSNDKATITIGLTHQEHPGVG
ncbi:MAG: hypothetical protein ACJA1C_001049 [Crocinitomicaceae bacterium]|jgi:hypothetical protein